jgi:HK97 family phage major capsid protein
MSKQIEIPNAVKALVTETVEKAVSSRMSVTPPPAPAATPAVVAVQSKKVTPAMKLGAMLQKEYAEKVNDPAQRPEVRKAIIERATNVLAGTAAQGGSLLPPQYSSEVIGAIYERSVLSKIGTVHVPYEGASLTFGKINSGVNVMWVAEGDAPTIVNPSTANLVLTTKFLKGATKISNVALRSPGPDMAAVMADDVIRAFAAQIDVSFLTGDGTGNTPTGLQTQAAGGQFAASTATPTVKTVRKDLAGAMTRIRQAKLDFDGANACWIMDSGTYFSLVSMHTGYSPAFPSLEANGTLFGYPVFVSESVAASGGAAVFVLASHVLMGTQQGPDVTMGLSDNDLIANVTTVAGQFAGDCKIRYTKAIAGVTNTATPWAGVVS